MLLMWPGIQLGVAPGCQAAITSGERPEQMGFRVNSGVRHIPWELTEEVELIEETVPGGAAKPQLQDLLFNLNNLHGLMMIDHHPLQGTLMAEYDHYLTSRATHKSLEVTRNH